MRIGEVRQAPANPAGLGSGSAPVRESRALVALAPAAKTQPTPSSFRPAPFIAHLLAVKDQHAQTRERRRAEPSEAIAAYRATAALGR
jgi:hypothetical protein